MIPTGEDCFKIMERYGMLDNIRDHSVMVEKVANIIAREIEKTGFHISMEKVTAGALMHDIGKTMCLNSNHDHAAEGSEICIQNGFGEIAEIVGEHIRLKSFSPGQDINEKEIVYYADKRVNHDKIVSLEERLEYLLTRYADNRRCREVEKKLFHKLDLKPEDIEGRIK